MNVLHLRCVSVDLDHKTLLKDVSFSLASGEILAVVGPNGAGKSTLLKAICGDYRISRGEVALAGKEIALWSPSHRARSMAVLPQLSLLNFPYTVREVVLLSRTPHATGNQIDRSIAEEVMQAMDIAHLANRLYTQLSGGEKQRTQLARVLGQIWRDEESEARLLILDEPTAALDLGHQQQLMNVVCQFAQCGVAVLMVVHDINIASRYAHRLLAINDGEVVADGTVEGVLNQELLRTLFDAELSVIRHPITNVPVVV